MPDDMLFAPAIQLGPVICVNCERPFDHFEFQHVAGADILRCGSAILYHVVMTCIHCGCKFYWNQGDKEIIRHSQILKNLLDRLPTSRPDDRKMI